MYKLTRKKLRRTQQFHVQHMLNVRHRSYKKNANKVFGKDDLANTPMAYWLTMATGSNKKKKISSIRCCHLSNPSTKNRQSTKKF